MINILHLIQMRANELALNKEKVTSTFSGIRWMSPFLVWMSPFLVLPNSHESSKEIS